MTSAKTQPTSNERVCLKCSSADVTVFSCDDRGIYSKDASEHLGDVSHICNEHHVECRNCGYTTTGRNFGATLAKRRKAANATGHGVPVEVAEKVQEQIDVVDNLPSANRVVDYIDRVAAPVDYSVDAIVRAVDAVREAPMPVDHVWIDGVMHELKPGTASIDGQEIGRIKGYYTWSDDRVSDEFIQRQKEKWEADYAKLKPESIPYHSQQTEDDQVAVCSERAQAELFAQYPHLSQWWSSVEGSLTDAQSAKWGEYSGKYTIGYRNHIKTAGLMNLVAQYGAASEQPALGTSPDFHHGKAPNHKCRKKAQKRARRKNRR